MKLLEIYLLEAKCPSCGTEGAYVGLHDVECKNRECKHYDKSQSGAKKYITFDVLNQRLGNEDFDFMINQLWILVTKEGENEADIKKEVKFFYDDDQILHAEWNDPKEGKREFFYNNKELYWEE